MDDEKKSDDDARIVVRSQRDPAAFVRLYCRHYDAIFRYCVHRLFERTTAEDVTSEVFLKVIESFEGFRGDDLQFRNWLYRIATNAVNQHLRKSARRSRLFTIVREKASDQASDSKESSEKWILLRDAILALKPRYQTIITLRFFENMKLTEIAEMLSSSAGTVRSQLARALAKLRRVLGPQFAEKSEVIEDE